MTTLDSNKIHYDEIIVLGAFSYPGTGLYDALQAIHNRDIHAEMYVNGKVNLENLVNGMEMVTNGEAIKVVVDPWM